MSLLAELKRRKIFRIAAAYLAVAIPIIAFVDLTYDTLPLEESAQETVKNLVTYVFAIGFPVALVLSWLFDWTPEGIVRDTGDPGSSWGSRPVTGEIRRQAAATTLRDLISSGPMSISRLLRLAVAIAARLDKDHAAGTVHGDLNPGNILIYPDDRVGLPDNEARDGKRSEAIERSAYRAPECARGDDADFRSDQFSLGAVLYEMATGRRAFVGANLDETLAAVMHAEPEPAARFNSDIPMPLLWTIGRCLAKHPQDRYASARELHEDLAGIAESVTTAISTRFAPKHNLPAQRTPLIGRDAELDAIKRLILEKSHRLVTITGAGGIGKTRLLIDLGRQLLERFKGGVYFVPLDRIQDAERVGAAIARSLGVQQAADRSLEQSLTAHLRQHCVAPTLFLLDNFEHVLDAAPLVSELLAASDLIEIVITSRAALRVYGEHEYRLSPLPIAGSTASVEQLMSSPAIRLFLDRAVALPEAPDEESLRIVADICQRLDGLPLAIELAAARTRVLPLKGLRERIREPLDFLSGGPRDLPARQQTLRATLEWSYELLEDDLKKLFRRSGVFVGGATLEAIEAVCNVDEDLKVDFIEAVETLVDNSLLRPMESDSMEPRFTMLETMREYALLRLAEAGEEARIRRAHAAYCLVLANESTYAGAADQFTALYGRFDRETGNIRAALDWLVETGDGEWGLKIASSLSHYWLLRGYSAEGYEWMRQLLPLAEPDSEPLIWAYAMTGDMAAYMGREEEALDYHSRSVELAKRFGNVPGIMRGLNGMAVNTQRLGLLDRSAAYHEEAIRVAREEGGSIAVLGAMLSNYADHAILRGDVEQAQRLHEETLKLFVDAKDEVAIAWALNRLGDVARKRGDNQAARRRYEDSLARFRTLGDRAGIAGCLYDLASLVLQTGGCSEAEPLNAEALSIYRELNLVSDCPRVIESLSRCALEADDPGRALTLAGSAAAIRQTLTLGIKEEAQEAVDRCIDAARQRLSDAEATTCWMAGWGMRVDQALAYALHERNANLPEGL